MSIIAAGTTTTTALSSTGNTDGTLQLQVNGTTPSVTLNTLGAIGVGSTPNYGTSGQALVSAGSTAAPTWANVTTSPAGSNTQIQYNNSGSFGASSAFVFDGTNLGVLGGSVTTPAAKIHAVGSVRSSNSAGTTFTSLATDGIYSTGTDLYLLAPSGYSTIFYTNNTEKFRFGTAGQLGIGGANYGTSGQVLTSGGSGAAPTWATPSSAMVRLGTQTVNGSSAINLDFISSTYTNYMLMIEGIYSYTGATVSPILQYRCSGTTDTNNAYGYCYTQGTGASWSGSAVSSDNRVNLSPTFPNGTNYLTAYFGVINISTFLNDSGNQYIVKANSHVQNANGGRGQAYPNLVYATYQGSFGLNSAVTGVSVTLSNSGTFVGKVTLYGLT